MPPITMGSTARKDSACSRRPSRTPGRPGACDTPVPWTRSASARARRLALATRRPPDARADGPAALRARPRADRRSRRRTRSSAASATCSSTRSRSPARAATRSSCCRASTGSTPAVGEELLRPGAPLFEYWGHEASWIPLSLYPAFEFRRREFRTHPWWGDLVRRAPEGRGRAAAAHPRRGPAALVGDGGPRQQGLVGPRRHQARRRRAVVERRAGHPRAPQLPADLRPRRARDPGRAAPPPAVDRGRPRGAAAGGARRPRLGDDGHARRHLAAEEPQGRAARGPLQRLQEKGAIARLRAGAATTARRRRGGSGPPTASWRRGSSARVRAPTAACCSRRSTRCCGTARASRASSASTRCSRSSSPRRSACTGTTACPCSPASSWSRASTSRPIASRAGCACCRRTTRTRTPPTAKRDRAATAAPLERYARALGLAVG